MSLILGGVLGLGVLLMMSPLLWPARRDGSAATPAALRTIRDDLALAGLGGVPLAAIAAVCVVLALVAGALAQAVFQIPVITVVAAVLGAALVPLAVSGRAARRRAANRAVWPDVVDHLVSSVRAGMSLPDSVSALAQLGPASTRGAFAAFAATPSRAALRIHDWRATTSDRSAASSLRYAASPRSTDVTSLPPTSRAMRKVSRMRSAIGSASVALRRSRQWTKLPVRP